MTLRSLRRLNKVGNARYFATTTKSEAEEIAMLEKLLNDAKSRQSEISRTEREASTTTNEDKQQKKFVIGTYNAVSSIGLRRFPESRYRTVKLEEFAPDSTKNADENGPHAILLRSFKLKNEDVPNTVRAVARCGAGVNNVEVEKLTKRGIPVFNSPGANANAVKELVIASLLLSARGVVQGIEHLKVINKEENYDFDKIKARVEKDKKQFKGEEIYGKKLGVVGLGHIGAAVADAALGLGMEVRGYDPTIGVEAAWRLPGHILQRAQTLEELVSDVDYISLHTPYMKETHHLIDTNLIDLMQPHCNLVNFARAELVNTKALKDKVASGTRTGKYIADFADENLHDCKQTVLIPHLGASTAEAENNSAEMAANQVRDFIETGSIRNSVNFPTIELPKPQHGHSRLCIVNRNVPGMLGLITTTLGTMGINIVQHINNSRGTLAYNVVDIELLTQEALILQVQNTISELEGVISSRVILNKLEPNFFLVNDAEV